jgi:hypothetical protein
MVKRFPTFLLVHTGWHNSTITKGSVRSWLRMKKTVSWIDTSHLRNQDGKSTLMRWHVLYTVRYVNMTFNIEGVDGYGPASLLSLLPMLQLKGCTCMVVLVQGRPCLC